MTAIVTPTDVLPITPPYTLPPVSTEQKRIIVALATRNVVTNAVAGSGKTTTILHIAMAYPERCHLVLTYNARLKEETRVRAAQLALENIEIHSYHSYCVKYIDSTCYNDTGIRQTIDKCTRPIPTWHAVIIDETQDMTNLYCKVARRAITGNPFVVVLGDIYQALYEFNGADRRYITLAPQLFGNTRPWLTCKLSTSYRITHPMAAFVNGLIGQKRINAAKDGPRPHYMCTYDISAKVIDVVGVVGAENIFILAPSVRWKTQKNPLAHLANVLATRGIPIYMPSNDDMALNADVLANKLVFSSFHQAKGLERRVVFVCSFDNAYFQYYNRDEDPQYCTNALYVACTRATQMLYLWASPKNTQFRFMSDETLKLCSRDGKHRNLTPAANKPVTMSVINLIRHMRVDVLDDIIAKTTVVTVILPEDIIDIPVITLQKYGDVDLLEEVADITGTAVAAHCEYTMHGKSIIMQALGMNGGKREINLPIDVDLTGLDFDDPVDLLYITNCYQMGRSNLIYRLKQITNYDWLTRGNLTLASERLQEYIGLSAEFECGVSFSNMDLQINGYIDVIDGTNVYELKTVKTLTKDHILQLLIYMHAMRSAGRSGFAYYLFNILTSELLQLIISDSDLITCMKYVNHAKFHKRDMLSDDAFIRQLNKNLSIADECAACTACATFITEYPPCENITDVPVVPPPPQPAPQQAPSPPQHTRPNPDNTLYRRRSTR